MLAYHALVVIRPARSNDHAAVDALFRAVGSDGPAAARWNELTLPHTLVAERDGIVIGCVEQHPDGAIRNLIVDPEARGAGIGRALMQAAAGAMRARGLTQWRLVVDADNVAAIRLYSRLGMYSIGHSTQLRIAWSTIATIPTETIGASPLTRADIGALERRFGLAQLERHAFADGCIANKLDGLLGVAVFAPQRADMRGVRVMRPSLTGALLASFARHAEHPHVDVTIENNDAVCDLLEQHGADVRLRLFHMSGALV